MKRTVKRIIALAGRALVGSQLYRLGSFQCEFPRSYSPMTASEGGKSIAYYRPMGDGQYFIVLHFFLLFVYYVIFNFYEELLMPKLKNIVNIISKKDRLCEYVNHKP